MFQYVTANVKPVVRNDTLEGKEQIVGQMIMINEGVHHGSDGPIYYPKEELQKGLAAWNHRPVVVYHPSVNGQPVSACDPIELSKRKIGITLNTAYDKELKAVRAEAWMEPSRVKDVDDRVSDAVVNQTMMECSTGLFMTLEKTEGEWNGEKYIGIARNLCLDHLAVLPDKTGACSIEDGAGFLRINERVFNEISYDETQMLIRSALISKVNDAWVVDTYDDYFIYESNGSLYKQAYSIKDGSVNFEGIATVVERQVSYIEVNLESNTNNISNQKKGNAMDKKKIVAELIANEKSPYEAKDEEMLLGLNETILEQLVAANKEPEKIDNQVTEPPVKTVQVINTEPAKVTKPMTEEEYIQNAPAGLRDTLRSGMMLAQNQRNECIEVILANENNSFTKDYLQNQTLEVLSAMAKIAQKPEKPRTISFFTGQTGASVQNAEPTHEPLGLPSMDELIKNQKVG